MSDGKHGPKALRGRDWIVGCAPRRALLQAVLGAPPRAAGWTKSDLARAPGVTTKGGVDDHVAGLVAVGLLAGAPGGRWRPVTRTPLGRALRRVLSELERI